MAAASSTPVASAGQLAPHVPGYDPGPIIAAQEQSLREYLNLPVREILDRLGIPALPDAKPPSDAMPPEAGPDDGPATTNPMDPSALISPVTDALGTLGNGLFQGVDPTAAFGGISQAFGSTSGALQQALSAVSEGWQGDSATAATTKTVSAIADGAEVAGRTDALKASVSTAAADVAQARARLVAIIAEFQATMAAIGPNIIFPWGWAAAIAAASKAIAETAEVMTSLQGSLGAEAVHITAAGAPVDITAVPEMADAMMGSTTAMIAPAGAGGAASPLMSMATQALSTGIGAVTQAVQSGVQAGASAANEPAEQVSAGTVAPLAGAASATPRPGVGVAGGGAGVGGVGGGTGATHALRSITSSPMLQPETAPATSVGARTAGAGVGTGAPMMGGAPMGGYGPRSGPSASHTSASFLHTTDQGGEIVGDLGTAAPPVLGELDPEDVPDVELRI